MGGLRVPATDIFTQWRSSCLPAAVKAHLSMVDTLARYFKGSFSLVHKHKHKHKQNISISKWEHQWHEHKHNIRKTNMFVFLVSACAYAYVAVFTSENGADIRSLQGHFDPDFWGKYHKQNGGCYDICRLVACRISQVISSSVQQGW